MFFKKKPAPAPAAATPERRASAQPARSQQRRYYRAPVDVEIVYLCDDRKGARNGQVSDLGGGGLRMESDEEIPHGTNVTMRFPLPGSAHLLTVKGHVVLSFWNPVHHTIAHGIAFTVIGQDDQERIVKFIHEVQVEELRKRKKIDD